MEVVLEREVRESVCNGNGKPIDGGIYRHIQNGETIPTMVLDVGEVARGGWAGVTPPNRASRLGFLTGVWPAMVIVAGGGSKQWVGGGGWLVRLLRHLYRGAEMGGR